MEYDHCLIYGKLYNYYFSVKFYFFPSPSSIQTRVPNYFQAIVTTPIPERKKNLLFYLLYR